MRNIITTIILLIIHVNLSFADNCKESVKKITLIQNKIEAMKQECLAKPQNQRSKCLHFIKLNQEHLISKIFYAEIACIKEIEKESK